MFATEHLVQNLNTNIDALLKIVSKTITRKAGIITLSSAIALAFLYSTIQKFIQPSKKLRHLPFISYLTFLRYVFKDALLEAYSKEQILPLMKRSNGVYVRPTVQGWSVMFANPVAVKQLLLKPESSFPKALSNVGLPGTLINKFIGGPSILSVSGPDWKRHRKIANPAFQRSMPITTFGELTIKMFEVINKEPGDTIDVLDLFERWTLDAIGITGFDFDFNALGDKHNKWVDYYDSVKGGMSNPFFIFFYQFDTKYVHLFKKRKELHEKLDKFLSNLDDIINQKRELVRHNISKTTDSERDLLTLMIESEMNEEGDKMSNEELRSNLCIFFLAGHDTTANTLAFALYELAMNPELQEKAREEAIRVLGDSPADAIPTLEQTKELNFLNMVIKETLRRHPPVYNITSRVVLEDMDIVGNFIPKGSEVTVDIYNLHHNPEVWTDPYKFNPDRFLPGGEADSKEGIVWAPFSNGGRQCIGMNFSLAEQRVVLSMLLRKYTWSLPENSPHKKVLQKKGIAWGLVIMSDKLDLIFKKRY
ncbi:cytochrome P450 [Mycotypha africana]|uniref:cytochrome P450 n=1 Tax=Mycotypha africana TaxID=64632 RepID=UPI00230128F8|nr:cytochrome P450 [Mycotypha africana]KAI8988312.1 cytochrome P450 [Mycotypha africana]